MFKILGILVLGVIFGRMVKTLPTLVKGVNKSIMIVIYALLFLLGISIGKNEMILNNLHTLGLQALWITVGAVLGSVIATKFIYNKFYKKTVNEG